MGRFDDSSSDQVSEYYQAQSWREQGAQEENDRVIHLLENETLDTSPENPMSDYDQLVWQGIKEQLIVLLKRKK